MDAPTSSFNSKRTLPISSPTSEEPSLSSRPKTKKRMHSELMDAMVKNNGDGFIYSRHSGSGLRVPSTLM